MNGYYINIVPSGHLAGFKFVVFVNTKKITSTSSNDTVSSIFIFDIEKLINFKKYYIKTFLHYNCLIFVKNNEQKLFYFIFCMTLAIDDLRIYLNSITLKLFFPTYSTYSGTDNSIKYFFFILELQV